MTTWEVPIMFEKVAGEFDRSALDKMEAFLNTNLPLLPNGKYELKIERVVNKRTTPQNRLMWKWFGLIASELSSLSGHDITAQDAHDAFCLKFLPKDTIMGKVGGETKKLNKEQMTEFLDKVQAYMASEYGITLPTWSN